jgi:hypothetical protein
MQVLKEYPVRQSSCLIISLRGDQLESLLSMDVIHQIEYQRKPIAELKQEGLDLSLNEVKLVHHQYPDLTGTGINLSIKENAFDTADIDFKGRYFITPSTPSSVNIHATNMASIAAGGANADPTSKGVAWDAGLSSSSFNNLLPDPDIYFETYDITVQNHSYGTGIENYYGIETAAYDEAAVRNLSLVHVFSSGNDGDQPPAEGTYAGMAGWANITGQFKQSKNTLTAGATDSLDNVVPLSSRGPAYDGRIKPDIVAYGHGGTSGAAAIVSGLSVLMQELYIRHHPTSAPPSSLIKAILANTAHDIGRMGPDFESGFGSVRGYEALETIEKNQFEISQVAKGDTEFIPISIPDGTTYCKVTLAWADPSANIQSPKALVNDLDLALKNIATGDVWYPWILSTYPHPDSLARVAIRSIDTINNIEQVTLSVPASGEYQIIISGQKLQSARQEFSVTWHFEKKNGFQWVYPSGTDQLQPGTSNILRWKGSDNPEGKIEYKSTHQTEWINVSGNVDAARGSIYWSTPAESGLMQLRWTNADSSFLSDTFISAVQLRPKVGLNCPDSLLIYWAATPASDSFEIFALGERHLEHVAFTTDTFYIVRDSEVGVYHYAVAPIFDIHPGPMSYGFDYRSQGADCYINAFYLTRIEDGTAFFEADLGSLYNVASVILEKKEGDMYTSVLTISPVTETRLYLQTNELDQGTNYFRLVVTLINGTTVEGEDLPVYYAAAQQILMFPNPAFTGNDIQLLVMRKEVYTIRIFDLLGKALIIYASPDNPQTIDLSTFSPGMYIAVVTYDSGDTVAQTFVVKE